MKVLITGNHGYIASQIYKEFSMIPHFDVTKCSVRNGVGDLSLKGYDVVVHTAALVHKKEDATSEFDYNKVNYELTKELALLAKKSGVKQFVFLSTMAIYGLVRGEINSQTEPKPVSYYGKSKWKAEQFLRTLEDATFKVAVIRPPMVYGPNCPGNYASLRKISKLTPFFPKVTNKRSMIFIGNLVALVEELIIDGTNGCYHPQDPAYINTTKMVQQIAKAHRKKIIETSFGAFLLKVFIGKNILFQKVFGNLYYAEHLSNYKNNNYQKYTIEQGIQISEMESNI